METFLEDRVALCPGDCLEVLKTIPDNSIDSIVTDPPYGLEFMSVAWDTFSEPKGSGRVDNTWDDHGSREHARTAQQVARIARNKNVAFGKFSEAWARECLRVLKPGGHLLSFGGTRTYHRMASAIEDAGFEIRDQVQWLYGQGFPKSQNVGKAIDKQAGAEREVIGERELRGKARVLKGGNYDGGYEGKELTTSYQITAPATQEAAEWEGWGTALKPAVEPVVLCSKPLTAEQHISIVLAETNARLVKWLNCSANDAENSLSAFQVKFLEAASSVLDNAKIRSLASIGIVPSAVVSFTFSALASIDLIKTKDCFALSHVRQSGRADKTSDQPIPLGEAADTLIAIMDMSTCVMKGDTSANIVLLWQNTLDAIWNHRNTFTIETVIRLTTALRILNSLLVPIISNDIGNLSPNCEPICLARKPLSEKTVAANVLKWGTGAINIDGCRVATDGESFQRPVAFGPDLHEGWSRPWQKNQEALAAFEKRKQGAIEKAENLGRWPSNALHDGSDEVVDMFPESNSQGHDPRKSKGSPFGGVNDTEHTERHWKDDTQSAARFFFAAKPDDAETQGRWPSNAILDGSDEVVDLFPDLHGAGFAQPPQEKWRSKDANNVYGKDIHAGPSGSRHGDSGSAARFFYHAKANKADRSGSKHPTVKPVALMQYLCRLITPPGGVVLDPFAGTGTTAEAAYREGFTCVLIEREVEYQDDIRFRMQLLPLSAAQRKEAIAQRAVVEPEAEAA